MSDVQRAAIELADRLVAEGKIQASDRGRIVRGCRTPARLKAMVDYFEAMPARQHAGD